MILDTTRRLKHEVVTEKTSDVDPNTDTKEKRSRNNSNCRHPLITVWVVRKMRSRILRRRRLKLS